MNMQTNKGIKISKLPFNEFSIVGVLLSKYFPSTIIYRDTDNTPIIVEWLDVNDSNEDVYIIFKTDVQQLKRYIEKKINHLDFILKCENGIVFEFVNTLKNNNHFYIKSADNLNKELLPKQDSFFDETLTDNLDLIIDIFKLDEVLLEDEDILEELSNQFDSDIIRLHFNNKEKLVEHGLIDTNILGEFLVSFNNLYIEVAKDRFYGAVRKSNTRIVKMKPFFEENKKTQVVVNEAASFSVYIKPYESFIRIDDDVVLNCSDIMTDISKLFTLSKDSSSFDSILGNYNKAVFKELAVFSEKTSEYGLDFDLKYFNKFTKIFPK